MTSQSRGIESEFIEGSENVFSDLGFDQETANNLLVRSQLIMQIERAIKDRGWSQIEAASHLEVSQPRISELMTGKIQKFTIDTLMGYLNKLGIEVTISSSGGEPCSQLESDWDGLISRGIQFLENQSFELASESFQKSLKLAKKLQDQELVADSNYLLAGVFVTQLRLAEALPFLLEATNGYRLTEETRKLHRCYQALGMVFANHGDLAQAKIAFEDAVLLAEELPIGAANIESSLIWLAAIAEKQNVLDEAEKTIRRILALQKQRLGDKAPELASTYKLLESLCNRQGRYAEAQLIKRAIKKLKERLEIKQVFSLNAYPVEFPDWTKTVSKEMFA